MAHQVSFHEKTFERNVTTEQVISELRKAFQSNGLDQEQIATHEKETDGISGKLKRYLRFLSGRNHGGFTTILGETNVTLDSVSNKVFERYTSFLQQVLLDEDRVLIGMIGEKKITNKYILLYEVLRRLVAISLSREQYKVGAGSVIVAVIRTFRKAILESKLADRRYIFWQDKPSIIAQTFYTSHLHWETIIARVAILAETVNSKDTAVISANRSLKQAKNLVEQILLFELTGKTSSEEGVTTQRKHAEARMLGQKVKDVRAVIPASKSLSEEIDLLEGIAKKVVETGTKSGKRSKWGTRSWEEVSELYELLVQIMLVETVIGEFGNLIDSGGWLLILSGMININQLSELLNELSEKVRRVLSLEEQNRPNERAITAIMGCSSLIPFEVAEDIITASTHLRQLTSVNTISTVRDYVELSVDMLKDVEGVMHKRGILPKENQLIVDGAKSIDAIAATSPCREAESPSAPLAAAASAAAAPYCEADSPSTSSSRFSLSPSSPALLSRVSSQSSVSSYMVSAKDATDEGGTSIVQIVVAGEDYPDRETCTDELMDALKIMESDIMALNGVAKALCNNIEEMKLVVPLTCIPEKELEEFAGYLRSFAEKNQKITETVRGLNLTTLLEKANMAFEQIKEEVISFGILLNKNEFRQTPARIICSGEVNVLEQAFLLSVLADPETLVPETRVLNIGM